jgi:hypothetical protein
MLIYASTGPLLLSGAFSCFCYCVVLCFVPVVSWCGSVCSLSQQLHFASLILSPCEHWTQGDKIKLAKYTPQQKGQHKETTKGTQPGEERNMETHKPHTQESLHKHVKSPKLTPKHRKVCYLVSAQWDSDHSNYSESHSFRLSPTGD